MSNNGNKLIFGPDGKPVIHDIGLAVLKVPMGVPLPNPQLLKAISQVTHCNVVILPSEYDLMQGRLAFEQMEALHQVIHSIEARVNKPMGESNPSTS